MTIEEAGHQALEAAEHGDVESLQVALDARAEAIALLVATAPSPELATRLASAIQAGNALNQSLSTLKVRLRTSAARRALIQTGFISAPLSRTFIDCRG